MSGGGSVVGAMVPSLEARHNSAPCFGRLLLKGTRARRSLLTLLPASNLGAGTSGRQRALSQPASTRAICTCQWPMQDYG